MDFPDAFYLGLNGMLPASPEITEAPGQHTERARVLVVEDQILLIKTITEIVESMGADARDAASLAQARESLGREKIDLVLLDLGLPDGSGLDLLAEIQKMNEPPGVIILSGLEDPDLAEIALKHGAWDYLVKPPRPLEVTSALRRALEYRRDRMKSSLEAIERAGIVGSGPETLRCLSLIGRAALSEASVLITGETGTGKELFARAVHKNSERRNGPFIIVDCASLTESIIESTLFGSRKGAFTGADKDRGGLVSAADGGTLFLDEVGELPLSMQKSFLRVLEEKRFRPVGSSFEVDADFRLVSATNRDLGKMVGEGTFRDDLLFRLRATHIEIPSLRSRQPELRELVVHFMDRLSQKSDVAAKGFTPEFFDVLARHDWPGNIRELIGALDYAFSSGRSQPVLHAVDLPLDLRVAVTKSRLLRRGHGVDNNEDPHSRPSWKTYRQSGLQALERQYFKDLVATCHHQWLDVAKISGVGRTRLYEILKATNLLSLIIHPPKPDPSAKRESQTPTTDA